MLLKPQIEFWEHFVSDPDALFSALRDVTDWDERMRARWTASFGVPYNYSGMIYPEAPMPSSIQSLAASIDGRTGFLPNNCLANYYGSGDSTMGFSFGLNRGAGPWHGRRDRVSRRYTRATVQTGRRQGRLRPDVAEREPAVHAP